MIERLYVAGASQYPGLAREVTQNLKAHGFYCNNTWTDLPTNAISPNEKLIWENCMNEITNAEALVFCHDHADAMRGATFEAGVAIGQSKPVIIFDLFKDFKAHWAWVYGVSFAYTPEQLLQRLRAL